MALASSRPHTTQSRSVSRNQSRPTIDTCLRKPIIPYLIGGVEDSASILSEASVVFVQGGELSELPGVLAPFEEAPLADVSVLLHIDLVRGLARDDAAVRYVSTLSRVDGIITVHHQLVPAARRLGLISVVRLFLQDTRAVDRGLGVIEKSKPDAVELLPGVAAIEVVDRFRSLHIPRIASGLVYNLNTIHRALESGCCAVSTSDRSLWAFNSNQFHR